jgi:ribosomal protein L16 Arg81 hydroxylase
VRGPNESLEFIDLISPVGLDEFLGEYWERKPLRINRKSSDYFAGLLSLRDVDEILARSVPRPEQIRVVKNGRALSVQELGQIEGRADLEAVFSQYRSGSTLVLELLHERWTPLWHLCDSVSRSLCVRPQVNVYLTPADAQGFNAHYDTHDVFILQLEGSKKWRLAPSAQVALPLQSQWGIQSGEDSDGEMEEFVLSQGDILYIPRGFVHDAASEDSISLHATLGVHSISWANLIKQAVDSIVSDDVRFRESLPAGFPVRPATVRTAEDHLASLIGLLSERLASWNMIEAATHLYEVWPNVPLAGHLCDLNEMDTLNSSTRVQRRSHSVLNLVCGTDEDTPTVGLNFNGKCIRMPIHTEDCLRFIVKQITPFAAADLPETLDESGKLILLRALVREGFLAICDEPSARIAN